MPGLVAPPEPRPRGVPGRVAGRHLARLTVVTVVIGLLLGCGATQIPPVTGTSASGRSVTASETAATQATLDAIGTAILRRDRPAYDALVSTRDPSFGVTADMVYTNLTAMPLRTIVFRPGTRQQELAPARRTLLGASAFVREVAVSWRVEGDHGLAEQLLWMTFVADGSAVTAAGTTDGPPERSAVPFWLVERLQVIRTAHTTTLAAATAGGRWPERGEAAARAVRRRLTGGLGARWDGRLVLEVPSTRQAFERVLGVTPGSYAGIAAVAWPAGPDPATAAIRIVVNPGVTATLDEQGVSVLLVHEAVHVATRSAASAAPTWLVEGFADYVAYDAYPTTATTAAAALLRQVKDRGAPASLPGDDQFAPSAPDLPLAYAQAWLACRLLAEEQSAARLMRFYLVASSGADVAVALQRETGLSTARLTAQWRRYLESAAARS